MNDRSKPNAASLKTIEVPLEPLTKETFAPYGKVIGPSPFDGASNDDTFHMINLEFAVEKTPELRIAHYPVKEMRLSTFERHLTMTESRVALGRAVVVVVAGDTPIDDRHSLPDVRSVRALLLPGTQGIMFARGAWHGLDCYPIGNKPADFAFFTEKESEDELETAKSFDELKRSDMVDYAEAQAVEFRITDPNGLVRASLTD